MSKENKCIGCRYASEHQEMGFRPFGVCTKETNLIEAEKAYNAETCPFENKLESKEKLTDEQITPNLINRLKEENEGLRLDKWELMNTISEKDNKIALLQDNNAELKAENKKLKSIGLNENITVGEYIRQMEDLKAENERLKGKDSVVLSREEYERLSSSNDIVFCDNKDCPDNLLCRCCEISECPKNILEYDKKLSANKHKLALFQKLCKERERADSWQDRYKLLEEELKQTRKETVKEIINEIKRKYGKSCSEYYPLLIEITSEELDDIAKQFGVEIKE